MINMPSQNVENHKYQKTNTNEWQVSNSGYLKCQVGATLIILYKKCYVHIFVFDCDNGLILDNKVVDHKNENKTDNRI